MKTRHGRRKAIEGLTLPELLITIGLVAILVGSGVPAMGDLIARNRMTASVNTLLSHLQLARSEAVKRGTTVRVCPSTDGETCTGGQIWHDGYIVTRDGSDAAALIRSEPAGNSRAIRITANRNIVTYQADGTAGGSNMTIVLCDQRADSIGSDHRRVILSNVGRARTETPSDGDDPCSE